jgi:hypothetical protein
VTPEPRPRGERIIDVRRRLTDDVDLWVATASADGLPHLVPLSFLWTDDRILLSTTVAAPTARNLLRSCAAQVALGHARDVVWIDAELDLFCEASAIDVGLGDAFASRAGFDPRPLRRYAFLWLRPLRVRAWREENELAGRDLMADGVWLRV